MTLSVKFILNFLSYFRKFILNFVLCTTIFCRNTFKITLRLIIFSFNTDSSLFLTIQFNSLKTSAVDEYTKFSKFSQVDKRKNDESLKKELRFLLITLNMSLKSFIL